jgi:hypothetical protein
MKIPFVRDERTTSVENASYRLAYLVMSFGLLLSVIYRSLILRDSSWDLLALVLLGGLVAAFYQGTHRILTRHWASVALATAIAAALIALLISISQR